MADDRMGLEAVLEFKTTGAQHSEDDINRLERSLKGLDLEGKEARETLSKLGLSASEAREKIGNLRKEIDRMRSATGGSGIEGFTTAWGDVEDAIKKANKEYREFRQLDAMTDPRNEGAFSGDTTNPRGLSDDQIAAELRMYETLRVNREQSLREEQRARAAEIAMQNEVASSFERNAERRRVADMEERIARKASIDKAQADEEAFLNAVAASHARNSERRRRDDIEERIARKASLDKAQADEEKFSAAVAASHAKNAERRRQEDAKDRALQAAASQKAQEQAVAQQQKLNEIQNRISTKRDDLNFEQGIIGLSKQEQAAERLKRAYDKLDAAQNEFTRAGEYDAQVSALKRVEAAQEGVARAQRETLNASVDTTASIETMRYALYDVGRQSLLVAGTITAAGVGLAKAFADWQTGMSNVAQTTGLGDGALLGLEAELVSLASKIPITAAEIQELAAQAGQLGIATGNITEFVGAMAQFGVISDSVSATEAGAVIAKLANILGTTNYRGIAAAIAEVGVSSAATDAQIIEVAREMGRFGVLSGMTADEVIGLSATFASLMVPAEQARSVMIQFANVVNGAIGGENVEYLQNMASMMGITADEAANLWKTDPSQFIQSFLAGAEATGDLAVALDAVGLTGQRALPVFSTLAARGDLLADMMGTAEEGMYQMDEWNDRYAQYMDDLASMWQLFLNDLATTAAAIGAELGPMLVDVLSMISFALQQIREFSSTGLGEDVLKLTAALAGLVTVVASVGGVLAIMAGGFLAIQTVLPNIIAQMPWVGRIAGLNAVQLAEMGAAGSTAGTQVAAGAARATTGLNAMRGSTHAATAAMRLFGVAIKAAVAATGIGLLIQAIFDFGNTFAFLADVQRIVVVGILTVLKTGFQGGINMAIGFLQGISAVVQKFVTIFANLRGVKPPNIMGGFIADLVEMRDIGFPIIDDVVTGVDQLFGVLATWGRAQSNWGGLMKDEVIPEPENWTDEIDANADAIDDYGKAMDGAGDSAKGMGNEIRTLVDYANDLSTVWARAFEIRFSGRKTFDEIRSSYYALSERFEQAREKAADLMRQIDELNASILKTQSSLSQQEYFLGVAIDYGDDLRADEIRAEIAKLQSDLAKQQAELASKGRDLVAAQNEQSTSLTGTSEAAIENRKTITDLVSQYQEHIKALAASGVSQEELARATANLKADFIAQATQLGYNKDELMLYAAAFDDVSIAIAAVPRNITVTANTNPALQALNEFMARARSTLAGGLNAPIGVNGAADAGVNAANALKWAFKGQMQKSPIELDGYLKTNGGKWAYQNGTKLSFFQTGGYTGAGAASQVAGIVHKGEYVIPKHMVDQRTQLPYADAMGRLYRGSGGTSYQSGGFASGNGVMIVELSAADRRALAQKAPVIVQIGDERVARATNAANFNSNMRGDG